ncbi:MAG: hypothetical protein ABI666_06890 [Ferruginibacter sp.]
MKKQFLLLAIMILAGICFSSLKDNGLKACCKNSSAAACSGTTKSTGQKIQPDFEESEDASLNVFMNPFKQL